MSAPSTTVEVDILTCTCCGGGVPDTAEHNVSHGDRPYPHDKDVGLCRDCGGDPEAKTVRKRMGWAAVTFFDARIAILYERLSEKNRAHFKTMTYAQKVGVITRLVEKGVMV